MMDPIERHRSQAPGVLEAGDPDAIKRLYVDLGQFFEEAHGDDPEGIPVLSAPETAPVVAALLDDAPGFLVDWFEVSHSRSCGAGLFRLR